MDPHLLFTTRFNSFFGWKIWIFLRSQRKNDAQAHLQLAQIINMLVASINVEM